MLMGGVRLRNRQSSGGVLIDSVHNPRPKRTSNLGQFVEVMDQRVDEGPGVVPRSWMDNHPGRLVDDGDVVILEQDIERNVFGGQAVGNHWWRVIPDDQVIGLKFDASLLGNRLVDRNLPIFNSLFDLRPGKGRVRLFSKKNIEPSTAKIGVDSEFKRNRGLQT